MTAPLRNCWTCRWAGHGGTSCDEPTDAMEEPIVDWIGATHRGPVCPTSADGCPGYSALPGSDPTATRRALASAGVLVVGEVVTHMHRSGGQLCSTPNLRDACTTIAANVTCPACLAALSPSPVAAEASQGPHAAASGDGSGDLRAAIVDALADPGALATDEDIVAAVRRLRTGLDEARSEARAWSGRGLEHAGRVNTERDALRADLARVTAELAEGRADAAGHLASLELAHGILDSVGAPKGRLDQRLAWVVGALRKAWRLVVPERGQGSAHERVASGSTRTFAEWAEREGR